MKTTTPPTGRPNRRVVCPQCGFSFAASQQSACPLCRQEWERWELQFSPLPLPNVRRQISSWLGQLPYPSAFEINASQGGLRLFFLVPPGEGQGAVAAWAALTKQQSRWVLAPATVGNSNDAPLDSRPVRVHALHTDTLLPKLANTEGDTFLSIGGQLLGQERSQRSSSDEATGEAGGATVLRMWVLGTQTKLQERLRSLAAYNYGTESGVDDDTPNPWGLRLALWRALLVFGVVVAGLSGGSWAVGWVSMEFGILSLIAGSIVFMAAFFGTLQWMRWRSIPKDTLEHSINGVLLKVAFTLRADQPQPLELLAGDCTWQPLVSEWPAVQATSMPLPAADLAAMLSPPEMGEGGGVLAQASRLDVPAPPPSQALVSAVFKIGRAVAGGEPVGIDPDGHGVATGGSRTGKSSFVYRLLKQLIEQGQDAPGIFLVDPHASLSDGFLHTIDQLPPNLRQEAVRRLRVVTPDQPEVVPLNLLAIPDFSWAGNAIVQSGRRIWGEYWGPRMQAALLGLFRLAHAWNINHPDRKMGLLHVVFAAFNTDWRHSAMAHLDPVDRMGTLALDALLGQLSKESGSWSHKWSTEVISPVLSKVMALELSPWLFAAMHQNQFVDLERWVQERCWVVLRLPAGTMGREAARLTAGIFYNVFDAAFRKATVYRPEPFYFIIDEAQEIAGGMQLEAMLSEGAKFGARMFVLAQSLSMLRRVEGFETVVQALLANTSTQAFFSPDPEDADLIRATLSASVRYGAMTLDIPSLHTWLRARLGGRWQPPTMVTIDPLPRANPERVQSLIREVIDAHPESYAPADGWQDDMVRTMEGIVPLASRGLLNKLLAPNPDIEDTEYPGSSGQITDQNQGDRRRLGWTDN